MPMVDTKEGDSDEQLQLVDVTVAFFFSLFFLWVSSKLTKTSVETAFFGSLHMNGR